MKPNKNETTTKMILRQ